ncbi:GDP-mannose 4,6-dehydratase [Paenibacillus sp. 19GGS1-52]|uniref:GDP-mannose 4,6-dehydratase n=1 Tax=Paenibacillus sp. 19GGS1-52 TaxID=2758563 RepID=UPI001EFB0C5A|nr:GDP-mannose 4,6-dehydratase [Paenibacillus sp. 19GGS1-52]ULO08034.1 GDP-mannose 4,6-dehydratase [Paenibacillus sp. 19GGS1-52]
MRALITGITGFVGAHLAEELHNQGYEVFGTTRKSCPNAMFANSAIQIIPMNYNSEEDILEILNKIKPHEIYHLAGQSSVKMSWENKVDTLETNIILTVKLLEALRKSDVADSAKLLMIGSSEEYGSIDNENTPITEEAVLRPISPYGVSKASTSLLFQQYVKVYGLKLLYARPFNHIGPGQDIGFVTSDFAKQIVMIEKGIHLPNISVGNLEAQRDFTDVRDIVSAYTMLVEKGQIGEIYNICSGKPHAIKYILTYLLDLSFNKNIQVKQDENKMRPSEFPIYIGDSTKIQEHIGWETTYSIEKSLQDILNYWRIMI